MTWAAASSVAVPRENARVRAYAVVLFFAVLVMAWAVVRSRRQS
jgi:hypothetical protein